ncbi:Rieske 2Fe-2S domain-containing protein [Sorangium sp. So ce1182]|uniref:Rieske 2Fe-2S domain-containing protein n=1 Tax=Sorangium sp. So ce1182 TaxID=3133334 RepID=UPI003F624B62
MSNPVAPVQEQAAEPKAKSSEPTAKLAASWYIALRASTLGKKPVELKLFGQPLVAWRDQAGRPVIMERHCAHLGASLADGKVVDGCIQCPFHQFRYDNTGKCVHIPGNGTSVPPLLQIPAAAQQTTYVTAERYGYIWIWYGSRAPMFPLPEFPYAESEKSSYRLLTFARTANTTALRVLENVFDPQHAVSLHSMPAVSIVLNVHDDWREWPEHGAEALARAGAWFGASYDAHIDSYLGGVGALASKLGLDAREMRVRLSYFPGGGVITMIINGEIIFRMLTSITPIDVHETVWHTTFAFKKTAKIWSDAVNFVVFGLQTKATFLQDIAIFSTLKADGGRFFTRYDEGVLKFRAFYTRWVHKTTLDHLNRSSAEPALALARS